MKIKPPKTRSVRIKPPKTRSIDPELVRKALGAEEVPRDVVRRPRFRYQIIEHDWNQSISLGQLQAALKPFGVRVYNDPLWDGTTMTGYIFTQGPVDDATIHRISKANAKRYL